MKYVPTECVVNGVKYYQYTAVDECTRFCFREMYEEHSTHSSEDLIRKLFKAILENNDIIYHRIRVATPRHNGKVERHSLSRNSANHSSIYFVNKTSTSQMAARSVAT